MELKLEGSDVDGADEALLAARLHVHHPPHAHHRVDVVQAHLQEGNKYVMSSPKVGSKFFTKVVPTLVYLSLVKLSAALWVLALGPTRAREPLTFHLASFLFISITAGRTTNKGFFIVLLCPLPSIFIH